MKTKFFFAGCLLFSMALFQALAQNGKNNTGSVSYNLTAPGFFYIEVNGEFVDLLVANMTIHFVDHNNNGVMVAERYMDHQVITSEITGKTYRTNEVSLPVDGTLTYWEGILPWTGEWGSIWIMDPLGYCIDRLTCDDGTVYIISYVWSQIAALNTGNGLTHYDCKVVGKN